MNNETNNTRMKRSDNKHVYVLLDNEPEYNIKKLDIDFKNGKTDTFNP